MLDLVAGAATKALIFLKNVKNESGKTLVTLLGHFGMSGAELHKNAREPILGSRSELVEKTCQKWVWKQFDSEVGGGAQTGKSQWFLRA